jgi:hypothetical protein
VSSQVEPYTSTWSPDTWSLSLRVAWTSEYDVVALKSARHVAALSDIPLCDNRTATYHCAYHINPLAWNSGPIYGSRRQVFRQTGGV